VQLPNVKGRHDSTRQMLDCSFATLVLDSACYSRLCTLSASALSLAVELHLHRRTNLAHSMPRSRHASRQALDFHVAPWQSKRKSTSSNQPALPNSSTRSSLDILPSLSAFDKPDGVPLTRVPSGLNINTTRTIDPGAAGAATRLPANATDTRVADLGPPAASKAPDTLLRVVKPQSTKGQHAPEPSSDAQPWMSRKRQRRCSNQGQQTCSGSTAASQKQVKSTAHQLLDVSDVRDGPDALSASDEDLPAGITLQGVAHIALLPSGNISGHIVDSHSKVCYGFTGRQVLSQSSCFRDLEWSLLRMAIQRFDCALSLETYAEHSGGDMAKISPADYDNEDVEEVVRSSKRDEFEEADLGVRVSFAAGQLLAGEAAEQQLAKFQSRLLGKDAVVNIGSMVIEGVPAWFLE
jgi:hypothetical protein